MNLAVAFADSVQRRAARPPCSGGTRDSYDELWSHSLFVAGILSHQFGVKPGERVGLWMKNCPEFIPSLFWRLAGGSGGGAINNFLSRTRSITSSTTRALT